jgi:hypothetical protein
MTLRSVLLNVRTAIVVGTCAGVLMLMRGAGGQVVVPPAPPVRITPVAPVQIPVIPGGDYTLQFRPSPDIGRILDVTTTAPGVTIRPLPDDPDGSTQRQVQVRGSAPPGPSTLRVVGERGQNDVPLVVVPPPEREIPEPGHAHAESEDNNHIGRLLIALVIGILLGVLLTRKRAPR